MLQVGGYHLMSEHTQPEQAAEGYQPQTVTIEVDPVKLELVNRRNSGASWLNTVALFAIVNSALTFMEVNLRFIFGLGVADIGAAVAQYSESSGLKVVAIGITLVAAAIFAGLGIKARKGATWAFAVGMLLYAADGAIWFMVQDWLEVGCHAFAVWMMFQGLQANRQLKTLYPND